jgi:hypothetical protein
MAFYIELIKTGKEEDNFVDYIYEFSLPYETFTNKAGKIRSRSKLVRGRARISKETGEVEVIELAEGDNGMYVQRATLALIKHWRQGEFPEKTCWAS